MQSGRKSNRREFLKLAAAGAAGAAILAACGAPAASPTAAPAAAPAAVPTAAPTAAPAAAPTAAPKPTTAPAPTTATTAAAPTATTAAAPTTAPTTAPAAAASSTGAVPTFAFKIGFIGPLTGDVKTFGESTKNAFELAIAEANAAGAKITTVITDDKNDPTESANAATKLINQDKVNAIMGSVSSKCTIPDSEIANSNKVILVTPTSTNPQVTVDNGKRKEFVFRACFIDPFQGTVMAKFALDTLKSKKAAVLFDNSNAYSKGLAEFFKAGYIKGGGAVDVYESYGKDDVDFSALLTKVAASAPDFLFLPDYYNKVSLIAKQAREKGIKATFGGGDGWDSADLDYKATEGSYFSNHYSPDDQRPEVQDWIKKYKAKFNSVPDALATLAYDATVLILAAAAAAGSTDPIKLRDAMAGLKAYPVVSGKITFDQNGDPVKSATIIQVKDGKQTFAATVQP